MCGVGLLVIWGVGRYIGEDFNAFDLLLDGNLSSVEDWPDCDSLEEVMEPESEAHDVLPGLNGLERERTERHVLVAPTSVRLL
jgi:hypothetical protein